jgi:hypothetical protein
MGRKSIFIILICALTVNLAMFGCSKQSVKSDKEGSGDSRIVENGVGKARKFDAALDLAFRDALNKVVVRTIGPELERKNREKISSYMYSISESYIMSYEITEKVKAEKETIVYVRAEFDKGKVEESIKTLGIEIPERKVAKDYSKSPHAEIINEAIDNLTYLVYFEPEKRKIEDEYARLCVSRVNNFLANKGYEYIDLQRIVEVKDDYLRIYEETQGTVSVVQLIAQALNADIYIVVDGIVEEAGTEGTIHFASASIDLKTFESATGRGLGTETGYSGRLGLASGMDAAKRKGVEVAVEKATAPVIELSREYMLKAFEEGIRYEVVVQGIPNFGMLRVFTDTVQNTRNFRSMKEVSSAQGQAKYYVYYMGRKGELIDDIMNGIQNQEGFENFNVIISRANAVVFGIEE